MWHNIEIRYKQNEERCEIVLTITAYTRPGKVLRAKMDLARISECVGWVALDSTLKATSSSDPICIKGQGQQHSHRRVRSLYTLFPIDNPRHSVAALVY